MTSDPVTRKLTAWKNALIDLTRRNPLVSLPLRSLMRLADDPDDLWKLAASGPKRLWLLTEKIPGTEQGRVLKSRERTITPAEFKTLNNLRVKARLSLNEHGVNVLFLVLGMLEWYDPRIEAPLRSPLLLLPVSLEPLPGNEGFVLARFEEEPRINPTLQFRLAQPDLAIRLPEAEPDDDIFTPSGYLASVADVIATKKPHWKVTPGECYLGRFSYLNLVMYEELDQRLEQMRKHPVIAAIAGDADAARQLTLPHDVALDTQPPQNAFHVLPADPSQERAILAARSGQSLVLQGPPGTGKTQTITNLIAACIADGKKVLFVSEKMAALEAVYRRLQECGLADLCLEAHSHKAKKHEVLEQLRRTLNETVKPSPARDAEMSLLATLRDDANRAVAALHARREPLGISVYEARGTVASLASAPDYYFSLDRVEDIDADTYHRMLRLSERLATFHDLFAQAETHPWRGLRADRFTQELHARVRDVVTNLLKSADALQDWAAHLWSLLGLPEQDSAQRGRGDTDWLVTVVEQMPQTPCLPTDWLTEPDTRFAPLRGVAAAARQRFRAYQERKHALLTTFTDDVLALPHAELAALLGERPDPVLASAFGNGWAAISDAAFAQAEGAMASATEAIWHLTQSAGRMAALCGRDAPRTFTQAMQLEQIAVSVLGDPKPQPSWFAPGAIAALRSLARDVESWHTIEQSESAFLAATFSERLYSLDVSGLRQRFDGDYASFLRVFKRAWYADRQQLRSVLLPGATLKGRAIADDLRRACRVMEMRTLLERDAGEINARLGRHYQKGQTAWPALHAALDQTETVVNLLSGSVPTTLQARLATSGAAISEIREQESLLTLHLQTADTRIAAVLSHVRLSGTTACPVSQIAFDEITDEWGRVRNEIAAFVAARRTVRGTHRYHDQTGRVEPSTDALRNGLCEAEWICTEGKAIAAESEVLHAQYAHLFDGLNTDWDAVLSALDNAERLRQLFAQVRQDIPAAVIAAASGNADASTMEDARRTAQAIRETGRELDRTWTDFPSLFESLSLRATDRVPLREAPFSAQRAWAEVRLAALGGLERWLNFKEVRQQCERGGLLSFCGVMVHRAPPAEKIPRIFRKAFHQRWLDAAAAATPHVLSLCAAEAGKDQIQFESLDRALIASAPDRIRAIMKERRASVTGAVGNVGEMGSLRRVLNQRRPRASVRKILSDIPNLLFRLKPCLMMSPLSVSLFLDPERIQFDVVIFDEASQIFPEFALGPLLRAGQAVIAGDSRQLPPTAFFKGMQDDSDSEDDDAAQAGDAREFESILNAAAAPLAEATLSWHYRSRHESLIDFSNRKFYDKRLKTFPSSRLPSVVSLHPVEDGVYYGGQGSARNNPIEARHVADLVEAQVRGDPQASVGVIAMSEAQQDCIRAEIESRTLRDTALAVLLNEDRPDGFFIKNIENVQGDERDVIFLSVGYGRWEDGKTRMLFGPLNREGGERRLNVAITRAKERLTVVSSLLPEDIKDTDSNGPVLLWEYLSFARDATRARLGGTSAAVGDTLVEAIATALEARGHLVRRDVGLSEYRVDLAVVDTVTPDTFLLGIECDSENYRSGETARAREWLRAGVLKSLGWMLHRVWSADWINRREDVLHDIERAIHAARTGIIPALETPAANEPVLEADQCIDEKGRPHADHEPAQAVLDETPTSAGKVSSGILPGLRFYQAVRDLVLVGGTQTLYGASGADATSRADVVDKVVQAEAPVHADVIAQRLCRAADLRQTGPRIKRISDDAIDLLVKAGRVEKRGDFVYLKGGEEVTARVPAPGSAPRPIEHICREEIGEVALIVLQNAIGMRVEEAINETARVLGYERTGSAIKEQIGSAVSQLEYEGRIHNFNGQLRAWET